MQQEELKLGTIGFWILDLLAVIAATRISFVIFRHVPGAAPAGEWEKTILAYSMLFYSLAYFWRFVPDLFQQGEQFRRDCGLLARKCLFILIALFFYIRFSGFAEKRTMLPVFIAFFTFLAILIFRFLYARWKAVWQNRKILRVERETISGREEIRRSGAIPAEDLPDERSLTIKRILDICVGLIGSILCLPVLLFAVPAIRLTSRGPIFTRIPCVGQDGILFDRLYFRTEYTGSDLKRDYMAKRNSAFGIYSEGEEAPGETSAGRWIKRLYLKGLPQSFNILKGEMSLCGIHPLSQEEVLDPSTIGLTPVQTDLLLLLKPGLICPAEESPYPECDVNYASGWSLYRDAVMIMENLRVRYEDGRQKKSG